MKKIKKLIVHISKMKIVKPMIVFFVLSFVFVSSTYAKDPSSVETISYYINLLLSILSWVRIVLATLAGKLMTNDLLYGRILHLDASLRTLRNIMKNFANFALGFMVLFAIVRNVFSITSSKDDTRSVKKILPKTIIAGVLIQASWFLMGALVDLSTIATAAISSFPAQMIVADNSFAGNMHSNMPKLQKNKIKFDPSSETHIVSIDSTGPIEDEDTIDSIFNIITPNHDSVAGPLVFLGLSVFNFNDYESFGGIGNSSTGITEWGDLFLSLGLSGAILIFFTLMMFFIFIFNLFRIVILWVIIPLLPIILLLNVFKLTDKLSGSGGFDIKAIFDIKNIFKLVFKPVLMVGSLSLVLVLLIIIKGVIGADKEQTINFTDHGNVVIQSVKEGTTDNYTTTMKSDGIFNFSMSGVKDTFADIIIYVVGLALMFLLVRMSVKFETGIKFIDDSVGKAFDSFQNILTSLPIVPLPGGGAVSFKALKDANVADAATKLAGIDVAEQTGKVTQLLGLGDTFGSLNTSMDRDEWISKAVSIGKGLGYSTVGIMYEKDADFREKFKNWNDTYSKSSDKKIDLDNIINVRNGENSDEAKKEKSPAEGGGGGGGGGTG